MTYTVFWRTWSAMNIPVSLHQPVLVVVSLNLSFVRRHSILTLHALVVQPRVPESDNARKPDDVEQGADLLTSPSTSLHPRRRPLEHPSDRTPATLPSPSAVLRLDQHQNYLMRTGDAKAMMRFCTFA